MGHSTLRVWTKVAVVSLTTTRTWSLSLPTEVLRGVIPTQVHPSPGRVCVLRVTSLGCLTLTAATGGTKAGVNRQHSTMWFTSSMHNTALAVILATSITFVPPMVA